VIPDVRTPLGWKRPLLFGAVFLRGLIGETLRLDYLNSSASRIKTGSRAYQPRWRQE
jgi:hypothetical protein